MLGAGQGEDQQGLEGADSSQPPPHLLIMGSLTQSGGW